MADIDFRKRARAHVKAAKEFLAQPGEDAARQACLRLRMAIEALTYQLLQAYLSEAPNTVMTKWQPKKVLDELFAVDPYADKTAKIFFGLEETPGVPAKKMGFLGEDKRFTAKWGSAAHNALGSFLHEPTLAQHQKGQGEDDEAARKKANEVAAELEAILATHLFNVNFGTFVSLECTCGFTVRRKEQVLKEDKPVICASCGRRWAYEFDERANTWGFATHVTPYECGTCHSQEGIETHLLPSSPTIICSACGAERQVIQAFTLVEVAAAAAD